ncbi:MAG TPA: hypothetical protein VGA88_00955 [Burkholderiales bacterium]
MAMREVTFRVVGETPLLTHNPMSMGVKEEGKGSKIPTPEVEAERGVYRTADGQYALPGLAFRQSLLKAAGAWKDKRSTLKSKLSHIEVTQELVPIETADGKPVEGYEIDVRRAVIQKSGILRARPKYASWAARVTFKYDSDLCTEEQIGPVLADAGSRIGVGDYRPERGGWFGRFSVVK